jgi:MinD superfamily P-loop ATPase
MKEIVVISGKGGTGKTSVSASFAWLAGKNAVVADCDVDAANMHLLLEADFASQEDFYSGELAVIDAETCINCGACKEVCRFNAIDVVDRQHTVNPIDCEGCRYCSRVCPTDSIEMITQKAGDLYVSHIKTGGEMVHAKLGFAAENSGKLVAKVKQVAKMTALEENKAFVITDGSPGIGCPVISSLSGASLAVMITEATVSGLHDLERVYKLVKTFNINTVCIINKYDLNASVTEAIETFLQEENIPLVGMFPYDETFTKALSNAMPIVQFDPHGRLSNLIQTSWQTIQNIVKD